MKLNIGTTERHPGWTSIDVAAGPGVDIVGDCRRLAQFADNSVETIYASHVVEHIPRVETVPMLKDWHRVLVPGGTLMVSVPDLNILSQIFIKDALHGADKLAVMHMMFGGQSDPYDFHFGGYDLELMTWMLHDAGFQDIVRVPSFRLFDDTSEGEFYGIKFSLNVKARKAA